MKEPFFPFGLDVEVAQLVLAWYLQREEIDVVIPGVKRVEQVTDNLAAADLQLTSETIKKIGSIFAL